MKKKVIFLTGLFFVLTIASFAADVNFKGMVQTWFSVAEQGEGESSRYGFTFRRIRFKPYGSFSKNIRWLIQAGWDQDSPLLLDAYIDFLISSAFRVRVGQFPAPGTISGTLTSSGALDMVERPMISQMWNGHNNLSGYRALGIQAYGSLAGEKLYYAIMASNPKTIAPFTPRLKSAEYTNAANGFQLWARLEASPVKGLRTGIFYGTTKESEPDIRRNTYGAHLFFVKKTLNFKIEYIAGSYGPAGQKTGYRGMYALLGYTLAAKIEPIIRFGFYTPDNKWGDSSGVKKYTDITPGINYFFNGSIKFQVNYVIRKEMMAAGLAELTNNLFYCCLQYSF